MGLAQIQPEQAYENHATSATWIDMLIPISCEYERRDLLN